MVSSLGRIKFENGRISRGYREKQGYFRTKTVGLRRFEYVHRLVARAFLGPPPSPKHTQINHKDGDRGNNSVANLEYATPSENMMHRYSNGIFASRNDRKRWNVDLMVARTLGPGTPPCQLQPERKGCAVVVSPIVSMDVRSKQVAMNSDCQSPHQNNFQVKCGEMLTWFLIQKIVHRELGHLEGHPRCLN